MPLVCRDILQIINTLCKSDHLILLQDGIPNVIRYVLDGTGFSSEDVWHHGSLHGSAMPGLDPDEYYEISGSVFGASCMLSAKTRVIIMPRSAPEPTYPETERAIHAGASSAEIGSHWIIRWTGADPRGELDLERLASIESTGPKGNVSCWLLDGSFPSDIPPSPLAEAWMKYFKQPLLPFDLAERRQQLAFAYNELAPEIERWEKLTTQGWPYLKRNEDQ